MDGGGAEVVTGQSHLDICVLINITSTNVNGIGAAFEALSKTGEASIIRLGRFHNGPIHNTEHSGDHLKNSYQE